jgi:outer membrane protein OmpA-like peptidoglycan-associated protein
MMHKRKQSLVVGVTIVAALCWHLTMSPVYGQDDGSVPQALTPGIEDEPSKRDQKPRKGKANKPGQSLDREQAPVPSHSEGAQQEREQKSNRDRGNAGEEKLDRPRGKAAEEEGVQQQNLDRDRAAEEEKPERRRGKAAEEEGGQPQKLDRDKAAEEEKLNRPRGKAAEEETERQQKLDRDNAAEEERLKPRRGRDAEVEGGQQQKLDRNKAAEERRKPPRGRANEERIEHQARKRAAQEKQKGDKALEEELKRQSSSPVRTREVKRWGELKQQRKERVEEGGNRIVIEEPDSRVIVREHDRLVIQHDETERFRLKARDARERRCPDGIREVIFVRPDGAEVVAEYDAESNLLRRLRRERGREYVIIDNRSYYDHGPQGHARYRDRQRGSADFYVDLPPPAIRIPREEYVVEYEGASQEDLYEALTAPPVEELDRGYALEEIRQSYGLRERMRSVDLDTINFEFGSWQIAPDYYGALKELADVINRILDEDAEEVFLIEGHTDAVGSDVDNLSLSDRRAESVAIILTDTFNVPAENLVTQGYGEQFLKIQTDQPERENRRVSVRRITPLMSAQYSSR